MFSLWFQIAWKAACGWTTAGTGGGRCGPHKLGLAKTQLAPKLHGGWSPSCLQKRLEQTHKSYRARFPVGRRSALKWTPANSILRCLRRPRKQGFAQLQRFTSSLGLRIVSNTGVEHEPLPCRVDVKSNWLEVGMASLGFRYFVYIAPCRFQRDLVLENMLLLSDASKQKMIAELLGLSAPLGARHQ